MAKYHVHITQVKACVNADMTGCGSYAWASCEEGKGDVGWKGGSLAHGQHDHLGEEWDLHLAWTLNTRVKGR